MGEVGFGAGAANRDGEHVYGGGAAREGSGLNEGLGAQTYRGRGCDWGPRGAGGAVGGADGAIGEGAQWGAEVGLQRPPAPLQSQRCAAAPRAPGPAPPTAPTAPSPRTASPAPSPTSMQRCVHTCAVGVCVLLACALLACALLACARCVRPGRCERCSGSMRAVGVCSVLVFSGCTRAVSVCQLSTCV